MRRQRGGGAAPAEACGVWLDTAELKRGQARPPRLRAASRAAGRKQSPVQLPQPGSSIPRQSSILSFLSPQPGEGAKENRRPAPCGDSGAAPPARPVKILPLPQLEEPPGAGQGAAQAGQTPQEPLELSAEPQRQSKASPGAGGASWCWGRNKPWLAPGGTGSGGSRAQPCSGAAAGDTNPGPGAAPSGACCPPQSPGPAQPLRERGQVPEGPCRQRQECQGSRATAHGARARQPPELSEPLFTQDSEGNRVIKHC